MLEEGRYDVVVGNPPYITVKDKALNQIYRSKYANVCKGTYALTVPFMAAVLRPRQATVSAAGWIGQITSNSFMKREFGIEAHRELPRPPGPAPRRGHLWRLHPRPRHANRHHRRPQPARPVEPTVRAVLGVRGEPGRPDDPAKGIVWTSIVEHVDDPGWDDGWITVTDLDRTCLPATRGASAAAAPSSCMQAS